MAVVWQNRFDGVPGTNVTVANSAMYGDPIDSLRNNPPANSVRYGALSVGGTASLMLGTDDASAHGDVWLYYPTGNSYSISFYLYLARGSWFRARDEHNLMELYLATESQSFFGGEAVPEAVMDQVYDRWVRVETSVTDEWMESRLYWSDIHGDTADHQAGVARSGGTLGGIFAQGSGGEATPVVYMDEVRIGEGEWLGPALEFHSGEAHLDATVSILVQGENTSKGAHLNASASISVSGEDTTKGAHLHAGAQTSVGVKPSMYSSLDLPASTTVDTRITWATSDEAHLRATARLGVEVTSTSLIEDPPPIPPRVRLAIYQQSGDQPVGYVYNLQDWQTSIPFNDVGSLTFTISEHSPGYESIAYNNQRFEVALEMEDTPGNFWEFIGCRFMPIRSRRDQTDRTKVVTWTCPSYSWIFNKVRIIDNLNSEGNRVFQNTTPGNILRTLLNEANAREAFNDLSYLSVGSATDSAGNPWDDTDLTFEFAGGTTYLSVLQTLVDIGSVDWRMSGRTLSVYNGGHTYRDRYDAVYFPDEVLSEHRRETSMENMAGRIAVRREEGHISSATSISKRTGWGYWEDLVDAPGITNAEDASDIAQRLLDSRPNFVSLGSEMRVISYPIRDGDNNPVPLSDYRVGDRVSIDIEDLSGVMQRRLPSRIQEMVLTGGSDRYTSVSLTLGDRFIDPLIRLRNKVDAMNIAANQSI